MLPYAIGASLQGVEKELTGRWVKTRQSKGAEWSRKACPCVFRALGSPTGKVTGTPGCLLTAESLGLITFSNCIFYAVSHLRISYLSHGIDRNINFREVPLCFI